MTHGSDLGIWGATPPGSQPWLFPTYPERFPWFSLWVSDTKICHAPAKSQGSTCLKHLRFGFVFNCFTLFSGPPPLRPGLAGPTKPNWTWHSCCFHLGRLALSGWFPETSLSSAKVGEGALMRVHVHVVAGTLDSISVGFPSHPTCSLTATLAPQTQSDASSPRGPASFL